MQMGYPVRFLALNGMGMNIDGEDGQDKRAKYVRALEGAMG